MAVSGLTTSWQAAASLRSSGTGTTWEAGTTTSSCQVPVTNTVTTRRPTSTVSTPVPTASTTPTLSEPRTVGNSGV